MARRSWFVPVVSAAAVAAAPASAGEGKRPPPPAHLRYAPVVDDPYFVRDAEDPRVLHTAPGFAERGFDRGYFERFARPPLPAEVFDRLEAQGVSTTGHLPDAPATPMLSPMLATVQQGNVLVVEGTSDFVVQTEDGYAFAHGGGGLEEIVTRVWNVLGDEYDFITVFTTFSDSSTAAYYLPLRQDTVGLGDCNPNSSETFGCEFSQLGDGAVLQGFVFMNSVDSWSQWDYSYDGYVHDLDDPEASIYAVLGQEVAHRWVAGLRFVDPRTLTVSKRLLGRDNSHWAAWVDTQGSVLDGWDWEADDASHFTLVDDMSSFSTLDLYAMGALPIFAAEPFFFIDDARFKPVSGVVGNQSVPADAVLQLPSVQFMDEQYGVTLEATGEKVDVTIQDIVDAEGNRCPDPDHTQKTFRQAIVLVTRPGQSASQVGAYVDDLETVAATWEKWWSDKTRRALTLCTALDGDCVHPVASLGAAEIEIPDGVPYIDPGRKAILRIPASATDAVVKNAIARVRLSGNGAETAVLKQTEIPLGDIPAGGSVEIPVELTIDASHTCGYSTIVEVSLESDDAQTTTERYRVFPGYEELYAATFDDGADYFEVNPDGQDQVQAGALERLDVELSCDMTRRTPERDASPGGRGAFVTGASDELKGLSSLWSPAVSLRDTTDPEVRFVYWLDAAQGGSLKVSLRGDDELYEEALTIEESAHDWVVSVVRIRDAFGGKLPREVSIRFEFDAPNGLVEGGIDEVRVLDVAGMCEQASGILCGCSAATSSSTSTVPALAALAALGCALRRRRRAA
jgi:hypothetical protein